MEASVVIKQARKMAGMSQKSLAEAAETSQPTIAAYESGSKQPSVKTLDRLVRATGAQLVWDIARSPLADVVADMTSALDKGDDDEAFRLIADLSVRLEHSDADVVGAAIVANPGSTGNRKWDALVGGIAERLARLSQLPRPIWTSESGRFCKTFWFVSRYRSVHASAIANSPPELSNRGVFCDHASLTGV